MRIPRLAPAAALGLLAATLSATATPAEAATKTLIPGIGSLAVQPQEDLGRFGQVTVGNFGYDVEPQMVLPDGSIGSAIVRWNPCNPIHWAINMDYAPKGFVSETRRAVTELAHATGIQMVFSGTTAPRPQAINGQLIDGPIKAAGLQLVIGWDTESDSNSMLGKGSDAAGETLRQVSSAQNADGSVSPSQIDVAAIALDRSQMKRMVLNDKSGNGLYHVLLHELGHSVGLNHVSNSAEVMAPLATAKSPVHYAAGDRIGLQQIGSINGCL